MTIANPPIPVTTIDATGATLPAYQDVLDALVANYQRIFGADAYLGADSQDGQLIGIFALAISNGNNAAVSSYNARSPVTAKGIALSTLVKINNLARRIATYSTVDVLVIGQVGTVINDGYASDGVNNWSLPTPVTIPLSGQVSVTATCVTIGAVTAAAGTVTRIVTPTLGWQQVINMADASPGQPIETDDQLRVRQANSTMDEATSGVLVSILGDLESIAGVVEASIFANPNPLPTPDGVPGFAVVCTGGDDAAIGELLAFRMPPNCSTYGTTTIAVPDPNNLTGLYRYVSFFRPTTVQVGWRLTIKPLAGFSADVGNLIKTSLSAWVGDLGDGTDVSISRAVLPIYLNGGSGSQFYEVQQVLCSRGGQALSNVDVPMAFYETAASDPLFIEVVLTP